MRLIAHRGFAGALPENTLPAVREAAARADAVEVDVRRCASGELVVVHDETVDRVSDGSGRVADLTLAELRELDVLDTGVGVPTLAAVLDAVPPSVGVNVELKEAETTADALALAASANAHVVVSSFSPDALARARDVAPSVPRAFLIDEGPRESLAAARTLDCTFLHPHVDCCDERLVNEAHRSGLCVNAWTVAERETAERLAAFGVDGVIADHWAVMPSESTDESNAADDAGTAED